MRIVNICNGFSKISSTLFVISIVCLHLSCAKSKEENKGKVYTLISVTNGQRGYLDGPVTSAKFEEVGGLTIDENDNIYNAQEDYPRIRKITPNGYVSTLAGDGTVGNVNAQGVSAKLGRIHFCAADGLGNVYIADATYNQIRKIDQGGNVSLFASVNGSASPITGIKVGPLGNIYIHDAFSISKYNTLGMLIWKLTSHDDPLSPSPYDFDGDTSVARFRAYGGIEIDNTETNIYFSQAFVSAGRCTTIKKLDLNARTVKTIAGDGSVGNSSGPALSAKFNLISSILLDNTGGLYIADGFANRIAYLKDGVVSTILGGSPGDVDGDASIAQIWYPLGLAMDSNGDIFIGCRGNNKIKKLLID